MPFYYLGFKIAHSYAKQMNPVHWLSIFGIKIAANTNYINVCL